MMAWGEEEINYNSAMIEGKDIIYQCYFLAHGGGENVGEPDRRLLSL